MFISHTVADCLKFSKELESISDSARLDVEVLLAYALQKDRAWLYTWPDKELDHSSYSLFQEYFSRRKSGEPVAYIVGEKNFWSLCLKVNTCTLIPRPDTELLVECALEKITNNSVSILDLGTGTGAIALAIAKEKPEARVLGVDNQESIVELARENAQCNGIRNVEFLTSHWFSRIAPQKFDLIVSNPPYIDEKDPHLAQGDVRFEPISALIASDQGRADIKTIIQEARLFLADEAYLMLEHGYQQADYVQQEMLTADFCNIETREDLGGNPRVTIGQFSSVK